MPNGLTKLKNEFLEYLEIEKGRSLKTVANYDRYLTRFLNFAKLASVSSLNDEVIRRYRLWLNRLPAQEGNLKKNTQNYHLIALRSFLKYLSRRGQKTAVAAGDIELAKTGGRDLDLISGDELSRLSATPKGTTWQNLRDKAILELLFSTGLRVSELTSLDSRLIDKKRE